MIQINLSLYGPFHHTGHCNLCWQNEQLEIIKIDLWRFSHYE